jgi:hypothetical protein
MQLVSRRYFRRRCPLSCLTERHVRFRGDILRLVGAPKLLLQHRRLQQSRLPRNVERVVSRLQSNLRRSDPACVGVQAPR